MAITFYPYVEDANQGTLVDRIDVLMEAAERYKAAILDAAAAEREGEAPTNHKLSVPRDIMVSFNWEEIADVLQSVRAMPEGNGDKHKKGMLLAKLAEVYEVLRAAKMSKLEAVRIALMSEANQLQNGSAKKTVL